MAVSSVPPTFRLTLTDHTGADDLVVERLLHDAEISGLVWESMMSQVLLRTGLRHCGLTELHITIVILLFMLEPSIGK